jgi:hypothetical protein
MKVCEVAGYWLTRYAICGAGAVVWTDIYVPPGGWTH